MEDVPTSFAIADAEVPPAPAGHGTFDLDTLILPELSIRALVDHVALIKERGGFFYEADSVNELMRLLAPTSFVRFAATCVQDVYIPRKAETLKARFPFLSDQEADTVCRHFDGEKVPLAGLDRLARAARAGVARLLRKDGLGTLAIARRLGISARWVRMIAPSGKKAPKAGSSKRKGRAWADKKGPPHRG